MKKLMTAVMATLITGQVFASEYVCQASYKAKIDKIDKLESDSTIPLLQIGGGFLVPVGLGMAGLGTIVAMPVALAIGGSFVVRNIIWLPAHSESYLTASSVIGEAVRGRESVIAGYERSHYYWGTYLAAAKLQDINKKREEIGLPKISLSDYLKENPIPRFDPTTVVTSVDELVKKMNEDQPGTFSYEVVVAKIKELSQDDTFCPGDKPKGIKKLTKILKEQL